MTGKLLLMAVLAICARASDGLVAQANNPIVGTWELNVSKSKMTPGPLPRSQTRTYQVTGQQEKSTQKGVDGDGKPTLVEFTANYDGKDYPYVGSPIWDTLALTPQDSFTTSFVQKKNGKIVMTGQRIVSKDGRIMTISSKGITPTGQPAELMLVFDRR